MGDDLKASECVTPAEASRRLGVSSSAVAQLLNAERLEVVATADGARLVSIRSIENYQRETGRKG